MKSNILALGAMTVAGAVMALAAPVSAQKPAAVHADSGMPFCSATVKDRCIQRADLKREGKSTVTKTGG